MRVEGLGVDVTLPMAVAVMQPEAAANVVVIAT